MANPYESRRLLDEYLLLHYGDPTKVLPWGFGPREALDFPRRCVQQHFEQPVKGKGLELGCAVGRASFELSRSCDSVVGIDFSRSFIEAAQELTRSKTATFQYPVEGEILESMTYELDADFNPERVQFEVGDATDLRADLGSFDVVLAANLLCRLPEPQKLLGRFADLVLEGGQLLITSPYTWLEEFTPKANWLGGYMKDGEPVRSLDTLKAGLESDFELVRVTEVPFAIREHSRKYQWSVSQASLWRRRSK